MATVKRPDEAWAWLARAVSADTDRSVLGCVSVEAGGQTAVSTDSHRLHLVRGGEAVGRVEGLHPVARGASASGRYPNWGQIVPGAAPTGGGVIITGDHLAEAMAVCEGLALIRRRFDGGGLHYYVAVTLGNEVSVLNPRYLLDALRGMRGWARLTRSRGVGTPLIMTDSITADHRLAMLMPVRSGDGQTASEAYSLDRLTIPAPAPVAEAAAV